MDMTNRQKIVTSVLLVLGLTGAGVADYFLAGREYTASLSSGSQGSVGVPRAEEADVLDVLADEALDAQPSDELTFLAQVATDTTVQTYVVLQGNDRIGVVAFLDGDAKDAFIALKESLLAAFSKDVQNLSDRVIQESGSPVRNVLSFTDPALSEEALTFIRIRQRLYEFHSAPGKEEAMQAVMDALTTR